MIPHAEMTDSTFKLDLSLDDCSFNPRRPVGLPVVDRLLGGFAGGETIGLLGSTGGGKTTLAMQLGVAFAQTRKEPVAYIMNDAPFDGYVARLYSLTSGFPVDKFMMAGQTLESFTPAERDHLRGKNKGIANIFVPIRMMPGKNGFGSGGVPEIRELVYKELLNNGITPKLIVIDQLLPLVYRNMERKGAESSEMAWHVSQAVDQLQALSAEIKTTVLLLHQRKACDEDDPSHLPAATESQGCKSWANGLANVLALGTLDTNNRCWLHAAKCRFGSPSPEVVTLNGAYARFECEPGRFILNRKTFVETDTEDHESVDGNANSLWE